MTPEEKAKKLQDTGLYYNNKIIEIQNLLRPYELELDRQHVDTVKNLATISGAIAALSLTIFSADLPKIEGLLIIGEMLLLGNVVFVFWYLIRRLTKSYKEIVKIKQTNLEPFQNRINDVFSVANGKLTFDEFEKRDEKMIEELMNELSFSPGQIQKFVYNDEIALGILGMAILSIVLSFLLPFLSTTFKCS